MLHLKQQNPGHAYYSPGCNKKDISPVHPVLLLCRVLQFCLQSHFLRAPLAKTKKQACLFGLCLEECTSSSNPAASLLTNCCSATRKGPADAAAYGNAQWRAVSPCFSMFLHHKHGLAACRSRGPSLDADKKSEEVCSHTAVLLFFISVLC